MTKSSFLSPMHRAIRQIGLYFEQRASGSGLTPQEGHMLSYLRSYAPAPVGDLIRVFGIKGSTMTSMLDRLANLGLLERDVNEEDRRSFVVTLTPAGRIAAESMQKFVEQTEKEIGRRVSKRDVEGFF